MIGPNIKLWAVAAIKIIKNAMKIFMGNFVPMLAKPTFD